MRPFASLALCFALTYPATCRAQDQTLDVVHRIKTEAFDNSKVMDTLCYLTDLNGPRLTGSPEFEQAANWAMSELKEFGVANVHAENWGTFGRSWSLERFTLDMTTPRYSHLVAAPMPWTEPTKGVQSGDVTLASFRMERWWRVAQNREAIERYKQQWKGKLKDKIILLSDLPEPKPTEQPLFHRYSDAELADLAKSPEPAIKRNVPIEQLDVPADPEAAERYLDNLPNSTMDELWDQVQATFGDLWRFFRDEGVRAVIRGDDRAHNGLVFAEGLDALRSSHPMAVPTFVVTQEQYSRMVRILQKKQPVGLRFELNAKTSDRDVQAFNVIGEIPGRKKPDEVVMIGAHFDSWASGTGATDNGAGSAVMLEVMRILKTLDLKMDRTVRIALWSGEEEGLLGSRAYVKEHFGDAKTMQLKPEHEKFDAYLNLDNGSGKIRGVYLEGNDAARPWFQEMFQPFQDLGVSTVTLKHTGGTDHLSFDDVGLPGFQFIQDPLDYYPVTHHSDMDTYSHAVPEDLMQASAIIAALTYEIANREQMFPRKSPSVVPAASK